MTRIYSSLDVALNQIENYMFAKEEDVYLCHCKYPSGVEYSFRKEKDISFADSPFIVKIFQLPVYFLFKNRGNALRAKKRFEEQHGTPLTINRAKLDSGDYVYTLNYVQ